MTHPFDGVRPRHAICHHCGYQFGGLEIQGGEITCPECGRTTRFELVSRADELTRLRRRIRRRRRVVGGLAVLALAVLLLLLLP